MNLSLMNVATIYFVWGLVAHLLADWMLQSEYLATYKTSLRHPAAWVHSGIHLLAALAVFPFWAALTVFITHILIDTRKPLIWWGNIMKQTKFISGGEPDGTPTRGEVVNNIIALSVAFWRDQVAHILVIAVLSILVAQAFVK